MKKLIVSSALALLFLANAASHAQAGCEPQIFSTWIGPHASKTFNLCTSSSTFVEAVASGGEDIDGELLNARGRQVDDDLDETGVVWLLTQNGGNFTYRLTNTTDKWVLVRVDETRLD